MSLRSADNLNPLMRRIYKPSYLKDLRWRATVWWLRVWASAKWLKLKMILIPYLRTIHTIDLNQASRTKLNKWLKIDKIIILLPRNPLLFHHWTCSKQSKKLMTSWRILNKTPREIKSPIAQEVVNCTRHTTENFLKIILLTILDKARALS